MSLPVRSAFSLVVALAATASTASADHHLSGEGEHAGPSRAVCVLLPTIGNDVTGVLIFEETDGSVHITGTVRNLTPGKHGFHVHEFGDLSDLKEGKSTGGHFSPGGHDHGKPSNEAAERHIGDLGNITAGENGVANVDITDDVIDLHGKNSIVGRGIVVHAKEDDFGQPTGNAGARVAIGVIGLAKDAEGGMAAKMKAEMKEEAAEAKAEMKEAAAKTEEAAETAAAKTEAAAKEAAAETEKAAESAGDAVKEAAAEVEEEVEKAVEDAQN